MKSRARGMMVASALVLGSGCASIVGFEELAFDGAPANDAGPDTTTSDAPEDRGAPVDGTALVDAGRDRNAPIGCDAGSHDFCEDFENPLVFGDAGWTQQEQSAPGTATRQNGELSVDLVDPEAGALGFLGLSVDRPYEKQVSGARKNVSVKWRVFVEVCPPFATHVRLSVAPGDGRFSVDVLLGELDGVCWTRLAAVDFIDAAPGYAPYDQLRVPAIAGQWHDFKFDVAQGADGTVTASLRIDDGEPSTLVFPSESTKDRFRAFLGLAPHFYQAGRVRIDDVRIDYSK